MFGLIVDIFNIFLYQPLLNLLVLLYVFLPGKDFGIAVIAITLLVRVFLYPLNKAAIRSQKELSELQPKIKEVQERWKADKERQMKETLALYKKANVNPFASVLPFLVQLPILIALFRLFGHELGQDITGSLYSFVPPPGGFDFQFLGVIDLGSPHLFFALGAGILQFVQAKMLTPARSSPRQTNKKQSGPDMGSMMQKQMLYFLPVFTVFILLRLPSALALYWGVTTIFSIWQQYVIVKSGKK